MPTTFIRRPWGTLANKIDDYNFTAAKIAKYGMIRVLSGGIGGISLNMKYHFLYFDVYDCLKTKQTNKQTRTKKMFSLIVFTPSKEALLLSIW